MLENKNSSANQYKSRSERQKEINRTGRRALAALTAAGALMVVGISNVEMNHLKAEGSVPAKQDDSVAQHNRAIQDGSGKKIDVAIDPNHNPGSDIHNSGQVAEQFTVPQDTAPNP